jgi:hypothetical protein
LRFTGTAAELWAFPAVGGATTARPSGRTLPIRGNGAHRQRPQQGGQERGRNSSDPSPLVKHILANAGPAIEDARDQPVLALHVREDRTYLTLGEHDRQWCTSELPRPMWRNTRRWRPSDKAAEPVGV